MYIYALLTRYVVVKAKCWPSSFRVFLWTEWKSRLMKMKENNLANIHLFLTEQVCAIKFVPGKKANHVFSTLNPQESSMFSLFLRFLSANSGQNSQYFVFLLSR